FNLISVQAFSKVWTISDDNLTVKFDDQTALLSVTDKRCNKVWNQAPLKELFVVKKTFQKGNVLTVSLKGKFPFQVIYSLTPKATLEVRVIADKKTVIENTEFPSAFITPDKNYYLLQTDSEGLLLPVDDSEYPIGTDRPYFCGGGTAMAWMGIVDKQFETGYMAILETPYDAILNTQKVDNLITFSTVWMPSMGKFGYDRKVSYHFFNKGGYVAQAKKYREYIWKKNQVITLKENQKKTPALEKMIGAVHLYVWDNAREVSFAQELKKSGIDKALILWDPNHVPYPEIGYDNRIKELGYVPGAYELFTDLKLRDTVMSKKDLSGPMRLSRISYPGMFNELVTRDKDGKTYSNNFGHTSCPLAIRPEIEKRVTRELNEFPHEAYFLDVYQANGIFECYSEKHPLTREQFVNEVKKNYNLIADKYHQFMGGEWGADFLGSSSVFVHGMMTLQRTWWGSGIEKKGTIYYTGDWKSNPRPTQMIGTRVANDKYLQYSINEYTRVPLYELVYHDAVVTSWRWEDGNHHTPEIWWKKDLFNMLYGSAPLWNLDRNRWEEYKNTFIDSYKNVCPWLQKIGYDELVSHRFVTSDHKVQESIFSSGNKILVNFGDEDFVFEGKIIKAKSFLTFTN
ncbi:glycoside hydrolase, partial [Flavobacterium sp. UBA6046]